MEATNVVHCLVRIDALEYVSDDLLEGKLKASLTIEVNQKMIHTIPSLGYVKTKSRLYIWNKLTASQYDMLPVSFPIDVEDAVKVKVQLTQTTGIPIISRKRQLLHS